MSKGKFRYKNVPAIDPRDIANMSNTRLKKLNIQLNSVLAHARMKFAEAELIMSPWTISMAGKRVKEVEMLKELIANEFFERKVLGKERTKTESKDT
jgi:hypothetical protein